MGWGICAMLIGIVEMQVLTGSDTMSTYYTLTHPSILNPLAWFSAIGSIITLWFNGTLWTGIYLWFYILICLPMCIGIWWVIIQLIMTIGGNIFGSITRLFGR